MRSLEKRPALAVDEVARMVRAASRIPNMRATETEADKAMHTSVALISVVVNHSPSLYTIGPMFGPIAAAGISRGPGSSHGRPCESCWSHVIHGGTCWFHIIHDEGPTGGLSLTLNWLQVSLYGVLAPRGQFTLLLEMLLS